MTPDNAGFERIVPKAPVAGEAARAAPPPVHRGAHIPASTFAIGIGILALLAAGAFFLLPSFIGPPASLPAAHPPAASTPTASAAHEAKAPVAPQSTGAPAKPVWDDPAALQARADAQDAKVRFEQAVETLSSHAVERWGKDELTAAQAHADAGAKAFAAKTFAPAKQAYEAADAGAQALLARMPEQLARLLQEGADALTRNDPVAASGAFDLAAAIDPGNPAAAKGLARVKSYDAVRTKVDAAAVLERADDLPAAAGAYREALALDADDTLAREGLGRVQATLADREFRRVLAEAVAALDRGDLGGADQRLARARALRANDPGVLQAAARLSEARRTTTIAGLQSRAAAQAGAEDWDGAVASYEAALEQDANLAFAIEGRDQARRRADLAHRLQGLLDDPRRLYSAAVRADAEAWLGEAQAVPAPGPVLKRQMTGVAQALAAAALPVRVSIRSDNLTDITVYRIGPLGKFASHDLDLKPGRYTAIGTRAGYRDVRKDFEVTPGTGSVVDVRCEETI